MVLVRIALRVSRRLFISTSLRRRELRTSSWCPEVGLGIVVLSFRDRSEVKSRIPNPTSGHLDRVTCWCPEVGLGISVLTVFTLRCPEVGL